MMPRRIPPGIQTPRCPICKSGNIAQRSGTLLDGNPVHFFHCYGCKFETSGRRTRDESDGDVVWRPFAEASP